MTPVEVLDRAEAEEKRAVAKANATAANAREKGRTARIAFLTAHGWTKNTVGACWTEPGGNAGVSFGITHAVTIQRKTLEGE